MSQKMEELQKKFKKSPLFLSKIFDNEVVLFPICKGAAKFKKILVITGVGAQIWGLIDGRLNLEAIKKEIIQGFKVDPRKAEEDLLIFLKELKKRGCVREV